MALSVTGNGAPINAHRHLSASSEAMRTSLQRLSSGYRITRAADDAAGLAISEGLRSQIRGMTQAVRNTQDGISVLQTAESALGGTASILQRMRDLAVRAANDGALDADAKASVQEEIGRLRDELTRIADTVGHDGTPLLDGSYQGTFQVGANAGETIVVDLDAGTATALGVDGVDVTLGPFHASVTTATGYRAGVPGTPEDPGPPVVPEVPAIPEVRTAGVVTAHGDFTPGRPAWSNLNGSITYGTAGSLDLSAVRGTRGAVPTLADVQAALDAEFGPAAVTAAVDGTGTLTFTGGEPTSVGDLADTALGFSPVTDPPDGASRAIVRIHDAIRLVSAQRADLGALLGRLAHAASNLNASIEHTTASESRIRDTDMAVEMTRFSRNQVLTQAGTSVLAQANQSTRGILTLLG